MYLSLSSLGWPQLLAILPQPPESLNYRCESPCGCWNLNSGPSEERSVLLPAEPSHQPPAHVLISKFDPPA